MLLLTLRLQLRHVAKSGSMLQVSRVDHVEVNGLFERGGYGLPARVTKIRMHCKPKPRCSAARASDLVLFAAPPRKTHCVVQLHDEQQHVGDEHCHGAAVEVKTGMGLGL